MFGRANGKYGRINGPKPPTFETEHAAIEDLLKKGLINERQASLRHRNLRHQGLMFLAVTNGGYTPRTKGLKRRMKLAQQKEAYLAEMTRSVADRVAAADLVTVDEGQFISA